MTRMTDLIHNTKPVATASGTVASTAIDTQGFYGVYFQALADTETFTVVESDLQAMTDAVAVANTQLIVTANAVNVVPTKRYVKVTVTGSSKVAGLLFGADTDGKINE